uniref:Uncharacterized protein n=1 Tax=Kocuria rosea subsp. polaris TaxID=136273 RepID=A0A0A6VNA2_KOCRO|nr:hypothetical protein GY22_14815 [Kocuria polaris]
MVRRRRQPRGLDARHRPRGPPLRPGVVPNPHRLNHPHERRQGIGSTSGRASGAAAAAEVDFALHMAR